VITVTGRRRLSEEIGRYTPFVLVLVIAAAGIGLIFLYHWRIGSGLIGGSLLVAAGLRALLPDRQLGLIALRRKPTDILLYGGLGLLIVFVAATITGGPFDH
jgi:multisubunit Na+/H+ antiporter MnhB subunit